MKWIIIIISVFLVLLSGNAFAESDYGKVFFKNYCFFVELAETKDERSLGLMFREYLDPDKGMLFVFNEEKEHSFWMKNVFIPLDIIWIDKDKEVVFIVENVQPCKTEPCDSINPKVESKYVLELAADTVRKSGLTVGDRLEFDIDY